jgi:hypothetical protein
LVSRALHQSETVTFRINPRDKTASAGSLAEDCTGDRCLAIWTLFRNGFLSSRISVRNSSGEKSQSFGCQKEYQRAFGTGERQARRTCVRSGGGRLTASRGAEWNSGADVARPRRKRGQAMLGRRVMATARSPASRRENPSRICWDRLDRSPSTTTRGTSRNPARQAATVMPLKAASRSEAYQGPTTPKGPARLTVDTTGQEG